MISNGPHCVYVMPNGARTGTGTGTGRMRNATVIGTHLPSQPPQYESKKTLTPPGINFINFQAESN